MKKTIFTSIIAFILVIFLVSCGGWTVEIKEPEEFSASLESESDTNVPENSETELPALGADRTSIDATGLYRYKVLYYNPFENIEADDSPEVEWAYGVPVIFIYEPNSCKYEAFEYRIEGVSATLGQLARLAVSRLNRSIPDDCFKLSVRTHKNMAIVDFYDLTDEFYSYMNPDGACEVLLNSIAATLMNCSDYNVGFTMNGGEKFSVGNVTLEGDGYGLYIPPELYSEISDKEFAKLRALCEYSDDWENSLPDYYGRNGLLSVVYDESVTLRPEGMDVILVTAGRTGEFSSPDEISNKIKISAATGVLDLVQGYYESGEYVPALKPIFDAAADDFIPREWVENVVTRLFGPKATVEHTSTNDYTYRAKVGVYTPPHRGGWAKYFPYVFSVSETADGYEAEVAYVYIAATGAYGMEPGAWADSVHQDGENFENDPVAMDFIRNRLPRYRVSFKRGEDGKLYMSSSEMLNVDEDEMNLLLAKKYIAPIHYLATHEEWSDFGEVSTLGLFAAGIESRFCRYLYDGDLNSHYCNMSTAPKDLVFEGWQVESFAVIYGFDDTELRALDYYDTERKCYVLPEGFSFGEALYPVITRAEQTKNLLTIFYDVLDEEGSVLESRELLAELSEDSIYPRYLSCRVVR